MILETLGAIFSGGVTGVVGAGLSRFADYKTEQLRADVDLKKGEQEMALMQLEATSRVQVADREADAAVAVAQRELDGTMATADAEALKASFANDSRRWSNNGMSGWFTLVDVLRGIIRPGATIYLLVLMTMIAYYLFTAMDAIGINQFASAMELFALFEKVVLMILYLGSTALLWWFGARSKAP